MLAPPADVEDAGHLNGQARLLETLALSRPGRVLVRIHKSRRESPQPFEGFVDPLDKQDFPILLHQDSCGDLGVGEIHPPAGGTDRPFAVMGEFKLDGRTAAGAVIDRLHGVFR